MVPTTKLKNGAFELIKFVQTIQGIDNQIPRRGVFSYLATSIRWTRADERRSYTVRGTDARLVQRRSVEWTMYKQI